MNSFKVFTLLTIATALIFLINHEALLQNISTYVQKSTKIEENKLSSNTIESSNQNH